MSQPVQPVKVSVIIPVFRVENYLERAVDSVLAQTLAEKEIILVDDGSDDACPQICDRYAREYPQLVRVIHKQNEGLGLARNSGVDAAVGEYVAFVDSDDAVDCKMYEQMYQKAKEADYDIVMCDVQIHYVEENRTATVPTYPGEEIDLPDYIANGNNITYSVNKLFRRSIWEQNRYEKMLFEDIALIPALVTKYPHIGYVKQPFYHYYRRANTISTTFTGAMVDIVRAFRAFIETSDPAYREEVIYCAAKQLYWNMTQSRALFLPDFIQLLQQYKKDFLLNPYVAKDAKIMKILDFIPQEVIPRRFICVHFGAGLPQGYRRRLEECFPAGDVVDADETYFAAHQLPQPVRLAMEHGQAGFAREYYALRILYEAGGIVLDPDMQANLNLNRLRTNRCFFGFEDDEALSTGCYGALKGHYVIQALLDSYKEDNIYNKAFLPLRERLRDFFMLHFGLRPNGRNQLLQKEVRLYLPSVLAYDMQDGENCCKRVPIPIPEGYELVSRPVLKMWSTRLMENWNLYKQALNGRPAGEPPAPPGAGLSDAQWERRLQEVVNTYEQSTCWRITKPLRALSQFLAKLFGR